MKDKYLTVTALTKYIKKKIDIDPHLRTIYLRGEISNFNHHNRGHMYLTIKDNQSRIQAVMFHGHNRHLKFTPENGMQVLIEGEVSVFEPYGQYQLYIKQMEPDGIGALYLAYEQLKEKLSKQGYFADDKKLPIPRYPKKIGIITSPTGAAVKDIITTIKRRNPTISLTIIPAIVQGDEAIPSLVKAIEQANNTEDFDLLIVGRGGGSLEDLWAFNDEQVVKAIFYSRIPVISAVGHETDVTLSDFAADLRASTPTGAGELAAIELTAIQYHYNTLYKQLIQSFKQTLFIKHEQLRQLKQSYSFQYPQHMITKNEQKVDMLQINLQKNMQRKIENKKILYQNLHLRFIKQHPETKLKSTQKRIDDLSKSLHTTFRRQLNKKQTQVAQLIDKLVLLNPLEILKRGFALPYKGKNIVKTVNKISENDRLSIKVSDGIIDCDVVQIRRDDDD